MPHSVVQTAKVATDSQASASLVVFPDGQDLPVKREVNICLDYVCHINHYYLFFNTTNNNVHVWSVLKHSQAE